MNMFLERNEIITIWNEYHNMLSVNSYEYEKYITIINKLIKEDELEFQEKRTFIDLIQLMADTIYNVNNGVDKYGTTYYQQTKIYEEPELNCCSRVINYLEE